MPFVIDKFKSKKGASVSEEFALFNLSSWCFVTVKWLFLTVPWGCLWYVIVVCPSKET